MRLYVLVRIFSFAIYLWSLFLEREPECVILIKINSYITKCLSRSSSLPTGEGGGRGRFFLETELIPGAEIVHIGVVVVGGDVVHVLEAVEDGEGVVLGDVEIGAKGVAYLLYCHGVV